MSSSSETDVWLKIGFYTRVRQESYTYILLYFIVVIYDDYRNLINIFYLFHDLFSPQLFDKFY